MKLEQQVTSLELSRCLKEIGVKQESLFYWVCHWVNRTPERTFNLFYGKDEDDTVNEFVSAFTVAELGEMLPEGTESHRRDNTWWCILDRRVGRRNVTEAKKASAEADARAAMLIHLLENKLILPQ